MAFFNIPSSFCLPSGFRLYHSKRHSGECVFSCVLTEYLQPRPHRASSEALSVDVSCQPQNEIGSSGSLGSPNPFQNQFEPKSMLK